MKRILLLLTAFTVSALTGMRAQTDVTSTYITNADFESTTFSQKYTNSSGSNTRYVYEPEGWSCEYSNGCEWDASVLQYGQPVYGNMGITLPSETLGNQAYLVRLHGNSKTSQITLSQTKTFPKGKYTLKGLFRTQNQNELEVGFYFDSYSNGNRIKYELGNGSWKEFSTSFVVEENAEKTVGVFFKHTSGNAMVAGVDNITLTYEIINKEELSKLIVKAKSINAKLNTLASEISSAESVYENIDDTEAYQTTIDNAITSLSSAVSNALSNYEFDPAGDDISWMITNNGFEQSTASQDDATTSAQALDYSSTGWTRISNGANSCAAVLAYGSGKKLNGVEIPEKDNKDQQGNAMGISIGWNVTISYNSELLKLPEGSYSLKVSAYNAGTAETFKSVFGFVPTEGEAVLSSKTSFEKGNWTTDEISFTLDKETEGYIQLGGQAGNNTSTNHGKIFFDNITLTYYDPLKKAQIDWNAAKEAAEEILADDVYCNVLGSEKESVENSISSSTPPETINDCNEAINTINTAVEAFKAAKVNYDALVAEIVKAKALGIEATAADAYAPTATMTSATALKNTQDLKVDEYNYVSTNYSYGVTLGEWKSEGTNTSAADFNNEHWSGENHSYKNQNDSNGQGWNANSWSINFNQDVTLPAGNYVFKVAGRQASDDRVVTSLIVKQGETTLGSVNDFPRSNNSRGINKEGATSFDENDAAGFANNGNGFGWEWRYVKFTLEEEATINIAVSAVATALHCWVSFGDYTLQTDNEANISLIAYNIALESAKTAIANTDYANVVGEEKTTLQSKIDADETLDKTSKEAIDAATKALDEARTAFVDAKAAYDAYIAAKAIEYADDKEYAAEDKFAAVTAAQNAGDATSKADAEAKTNAIVSAYRKYVESHAMAEGVEGAVDKTELIKDSNFANVTIDGTKAGAWTFDQTGGSANINSNEPMTDGEGNSSYSYYDYYNGGNNNQNLHQEIENLEPGRYLLTVTARGHANFNNNLQLYVVGKGKVMIPAIGSTGGTFGRGWNDASIEFYQNETANITIGVKTDNSKNQWWGATRFRLVKLPAEPVSMSVKAGKYGTFIAPFNVALPESVKAYTVTDMDGSTLVMSPVEGSTLEANTAVVLENTTEENIAKEFFGKSVATEDTYKTGLLTGYYKPVLVAASTDAVSNYILQTQDGKQAFRKVTADYTTQTPNRAYLTVEGSSNVKSVFFPSQGDATGINAVSTLLGGDVEGIYTVGGAKVNSLQKGVNIIRTADGKAQKVLVK